MGKPKTKLERTREARWDEITNAYRRRHRQFVMEYLPTMDAASWKLYEKWVAGFGATNMNTASRNSRRVRRQMAQLRVRVQWAE